MYSQGSCAFDLRNIRGVARTTCRGLGRCSGRLLVSVAQPAAAMEMVFMVRMEIFA